MNCKFCTKVITNKGSLASHEKQCQSNPNRIAHPHSPKAGAQKGVASKRLGIKTGPKVNEKFSHDKSETII